MTRIVGAVKFFPIDLTRADGDRGRDGEDEELVHGDDCVEEEGVLIERSMN